MSDTEQDKQENAPEVNMAELAGEDLNAPKETEENENSHLEGNTEPEGVDPDEVNLVRPEWLPEKFWDAENGINNEKLAKSYSDLEKKFSRGDHKAPKEYDTKFLGENIPEDDAMLNGYKDMALRYGFSQDDFEGLAKQFIDQQQSQEVDRQEYIRQQKEKLGNNAVELIRSNHEWATGLLNKGLISNEEMQVLDTMGGSADGTRLIRKLRNMSGAKEIPIPSMQGERKTREELQAMVADPRWKTDPAYRARVEKEFYENIA